MAFFIQALFFNLASYICPSVKNKAKKRHIAILGSTGSIGRQALDVIAANQNVFQAEVLTANSNADLLIQQAKTFQPNTVVIADKSKYKQVQSALSANKIKVYAGEEALQQVVQMESVHFVLTALVGFSGLLPTIKAIQAKKHIALANKETLVVAGEIITQLAEENKVMLLPVDSEHSAIFQCLVGENLNPIEKIYLTCSGGPFRGKTRKELINAGKNEALQHPNWEMGSKITIDSASLMNKGLEVIEAKWLFGLQSDQIDVIVHPQSILHSIVQFDDGSMKAQMGLPDMKLPIQYALGYPLRLESDFERFNFMDYPQLTFEQPDKKTFKNLELAYSAMRKAGNSPCVLNAANEVAVSAFLEEKVGFLQMSDLIETALAKIEYIEQPTIEDYLQTDKETRALLQQQIN